MNREQAAAGEQGRACEARANCRQSFCAAADCPIRLLTTCRRSGTSRSSSISVSSVIKGEEREDIGDSSDFSCSHAPTKTDGRRSIKDFRRETKRPLDVATKRACKVGGWLSFTSLPESASRRTSDRRRSAQRGRRTRRWPPWPRDDPSAWSPRSPWRAGRRVW
jgi:hypothetical protein